MMRALIIVLGLFAMTVSNAPAQEKIKIGFLVHDLVTERWQADMENFSKKVTELGGEPVTRNAFGDASTQLQQGKELIDQGVKVIAVVAQNGQTLGELVDYANNAGVKIVAYDRMIMNCDLPFYISFNSVMVGELIADYALKVKPRGNYIVLNGPSTDNNATLVKKGVMNMLSPAIQRGDIKILVNKEMDSWNALNTLMFMEEFLSTNKEPIDAIVTPSDDMATGALDALKIDHVKVPVITGQNATVEACRNIMKGMQTMTVYKDILKLANEAAILCMRIANGEKVTAASTTNNGKVDVPSILFEPVVIDKDNLKQLLVPNHISEEQLR